MTLPLPGFGPEPDDTPTTRSEKDPATHKPTPLAALRARCETCRSCPAQIVYVVTYNKRTKKHSRMPVDVDPDPGGNVLVYSVGRVLHGHVLNKADATARDDLHSSHFDSCPDAPAYRTRGRKP
jgi:hypothetical protein